MGWVDSGVLGTTDGFALGHASSVLGGAVVECLIVRGYILKCVLAAREAGMAQDAAWDDLPLLFPSLVGPRRLPSLQQPSLRSRLWMERQMCTLPCRTSTGSVGPPRMPCYIS